MEIVDVVKVISEKIVFDAEDYSIRVSSKQLWKFFMKIKKLSPDGVEREIRKFVTDKSINKNEYYLDEVYIRNVNMLSKSMLDYFEQFVAFLTEEEVEDSVSVVKTYKYGEVEHSLNSEEEVEVEKVNL